MGRNRLPNKAPDELLTGCVRRWHGAGAQVVQGTRCIDESLQDAVSCSSIHGGHIPSDLRLELRTSGTSRMDRIPRSLRQDEPANPSVPTVTNPLQVPVADELGGPLRAGLLGDAETSSQLRHGRSRHLETLKDVPVHPAQAGVVLLEALEEPTLAGPPGEHGEDWKIQIGIWHRRSHCGR